MYTENHYLEEVHSTRQFEISKLSFAFAVHFPVVILKQNRKNLRTCEFSDENPLPKQD